MEPADLIELEAIKRLKYAYLRCLDTKAWDELATLFIEGAEASYSGGRYHYVGRDEIVGFISRNMGAETFHSSHRCHHPEIDLTGPTTATGTWALEDVVVETQWDIIIHGAAFYTDDYVKEGGRWLIARTGYKRTYEQLVPRSALPGAQITASWWATGGQSQLPVQ